MKTDGAVVGTALGKLHIHCENNVVTALSWAADDAAETAGDTAAARKAAREVNDYFSGGRRTFSFPIRYGGTDFQQAVWRAVQAIPYGRTCTYGEIARRIGAPAAVRAAAAAIGRNPLMVVIPCHRVIGADGRLTGYAGGLARKEKLLALERDVLRRGE